MAAKVQGPRSSAEGAGVGITAHLRAHLHVLPACLFPYRHPMASAPAAAELHRPPLACMCSSCSARLVVTKGSEEGIVRKVATLTARGRGMMEGAVHWSD